LTVDPQHAEDGVADVYLLFELGVPLRVWTVYVSMCVPCAVSFLFNFLAVTLDLDAVTTLIVLLG
jgi:hypothetical protein